MTSNPTSQSRELSPYWRVQDPGKGKPLFGKDFTPTENAVHERWLMCHRIAREAYDKGLIADPLFVNRHYTWFKLWFAGGIPTGTLINRTGVSFRGHNNKKRRR